MKTIERHRPMTCGFWLCKAIGHKIVFRDMVAGNTIYCRMCLRTGRPV